MSYTNAPAPTRRSNGHGAEPHAAEAVKERLDALKDDANGLASAISAAAKEKVQEGRQRLEAAGEAVAERAQTAFTAVEDQVRERPAIVLGAAIGAGFLLGLLLAPRR